MTKPRWRWHLRYLLASACLLVLAAALSPLPDARAQAASVLTLMPDRGACGIPAPGVLVRGDGFPAGRALILLVRRVTPLSDQRSEGATATIAADGTFATELRLYMCRPDDVEGAQFQVTAHVRDGRDFGPALASATFTKSASSAAPPGLPNTGGGGQASASVPANPLVAVVAAFLLSSSVVGYARRSWLTHLRAR